MNDFRWSIAVFFFTSLLGCSSWKLAAPNAPTLGAMSRPPAEMAKVCMVRTSELGSTITFVSRDNGVLVGATRGPTYFCYLAEPGEHAIEIEASDGVEKAKLLAEAGRSYVLNEEVNYVFGSVTCNAVWMEEQAAKELFERSDLEILVGVPGSEALPPNPPVAPARKAMGST